MLKKLLNRLGGGGKDRKPAAPKISREDKKLFAAHRKRDAELGLPTAATLNERAGSAAKKGHWKTAAAAFAQGADVNYVTLDISFFGAVYLPVSFLAIEQNRSQELKQLLQSGADRLATRQTVIFTANSVTFETGMLDHAAQKGSAEVVSVLLEGPAWPQGQLDNALRLAAARKEMAPAVGQLLSHGAQGYAAALYAAEKADNAGAIRLLRAAEKNSAAAPPSNPDQERFELNQKAFRAMLENVPAKDRGRLLESLKKSFPGSDGEASPSSSATAAPDYALQRDVTLSRPISFKNTK